MNPMDIFKPPERQKKEPIVLPPIEVPEVLKDWHAQVKKVLEKIARDGSY